MAKGTHWIIGSVISAERGRYSTADNAIYNLITIASPLIFRYTFAFDRIATGHTLSDYIGKYVTISYHYTPSGRSIIDNITVVAKQ